MEENRKLEDIDRREALELNYQQIDKRVLNAKIMPEHREIEPNETTEFIH